MNSKAASPGRPAQWRAHRDIVALLRARASEQYSGRSAFVFLGDGETETGRLGFEELDRRARAIAVHLLKAARAGERALLLFPPGLDFLTAFFGCLYAGVVAVPVNPPSRKYIVRLRAIVDDAAAAIVVTTTRLREQYQTQSTQPWRLDELHWLVTDELDLALAERWTPPAITPNSLAFLQYTSGSTGAPKGVMISHGNLLSNEAAIEAAFGHTSASNVVGWLPLYHDMGLIGNVLQPLFVGSTAIIMPPFAFLEKPMRWLRAISKYKANTSGGPNFAYELCVRQISEDEKLGLDLSCWTLAFNGSETVRASTLARFAGAFASCGFRPEAFYPCYGLAEATLFVSGPKRGHPPTVRRFDRVALSQGLAVEEVDLFDEREGLVSCGQPDTRDRLKIVDPETLQIFPEGRIGEIWVAGPSVAQGYWGQEEVTSQTFCAHMAGGEGRSYLRTGDLGFILDGALFIAGRIKDLIIIRGANYYASDFERILDHKVPGLRPGCNAAFSVDRNNEEILVLVAEVQRHFLRKHGEAVIFKAARAAVASEYDLAIGEIVLVPPVAVPKTTSGKIRRRACRDAYLAGDLKILARSGEGLADPFGPSHEIPLAPAAISNPIFKTLRTAADIERLLRCEIARILRCSQSEIQPDGSLAELGLDSLRTVVLKHSVDAFLSADVPLEMLMAGESLSELAKQILALPRLESNRDSADTGALSSMQRAIWTVHKLDGGSVAYNLHLALEIKGGLHTATLRKALTLILERHDQLRTVYGFESGIPRQAAQPLSKLKEWFTVVNASGWHRTALQADMAKWAREPFDLQHGPLLRVVAYSLSESSAALLFCAHHIAVDLWSLLLLLQEFDETYRALQSGRPLKPHRGGAYADFVAWQQEYLESARASKDWDYWRSQLDHALPILALPLDYPRPLSASFRGSSKALRIGPDLTAALRALASREGVSLFTLLLAVYLVVLHRYCGQDEIVVGVPSSGRLQASFAKLVGNCVNPLAIVGRLHPALSFSAFLKELGEQVRSALAHQCFPFPILVERLQPERHGDQWPIYQTSFVLQQAQPDVPSHLAPLALSENGEPFSWCGCTVQAMALPERVENFDLKVMAAESHAELVISFQYRAELFLPETIARMAGHFSTLLEAISAAPNTCLGELPLLREHERHQQLTERNATTCSYRAEVCLQELFEEQVVRTPRAVAVTFEGQRLNYSELNAHANQLAHHLRSFGVGPDVRVGLCLERSLELVVGILGVLKAGGAYLPLDCEYPQERLSYMVRDAAPRLIVTKERFVSLLPEGVDRLCLDKDWDEVAGRSSANPDNLTRPANLAYVIYTSGSTGKPKGVAVSHGAVVNCLEWTRAYLEATSEDVALQKTPFGFDVSVCELLLPLLSGARLVVAQPGDHQDPARLTRIIAQENVTIIHFVPSMLQAFLDRPGLPQLPALRHVICIGEALSSGLRDQFYASQRAELHNLYGPTEAAIHVTASICARESKDASVPIGRPIWNTQIYLLDSALNPVPVNVAGELYIGGVGLARGYLGRPDLTAERFVPNPFAGEAKNAGGGRLYRTGDLARFRPDGSIEYLGRIDHQVKLRGFRIELGEIEAALSGLDGVHQAAVVLREDRPGHKQLVAYIVSSLGPRFDPAVLQKRLAQELPDHMIPVAFVALDAMPLTPSGKVDRKALPAPQICFDAADYVPPQTYEETLLAEIWEKVLGIARVGVADNFFARGGDSILSIQVASRAHASGFDLSPRLIFLHPTIKSLAPLMLPITEQSPEPKVLPLEQFALADLPQEQISSLKHEYHDLQDLYPLTPLQEGMLFHCLLHPGRGMYVLQDQYEIRSKLDVDAFRDAWQRTIDNHDILRSAILWRQIEKPHQGVQRKAQLPFFFEDQRKFTSAQQEEHIAQLLAAERQNGIDLEKPPLMAIRLFRLGEDRWRCVRSHHHILTDDWCTSPLFVEFRDNYAALVSSNPLPERPVYPFRNYIAWLKQQDFSAAEAFWRNALDGFREPTPLAIDRTPITRPGIAGVVRDVQMTLDRKATSALQQAARRYNLTPNTLVQAAWALLLARYANRSEVVFGVTVSGRPAELPGVEQTLGLFINTLPLRLELRETQRILDWWHEIQRTNADLRRFEHTPLVQCQTWSEVPSGTDLFRHLLVYENAPIDPSLLTDRSVIDMRFIGNRVHTNYPITATVIPGEALELRITYQAARFEPTRIERFLAHFMGLLKSTIAQPQSCVSDHSLLLPDERRQILRSWNATAHQYPPGADFVSALEAQVDVTPNAMAARCDEAHLTYSELNNRVNRLAHGLIARGVGPEIVVAVIDERGVQFLIMMLAVLKAGGVYLPLDLHQPTLRNLTIIKESGAKLILSGRLGLSGLKEQLAESMADVVAPDEVEIEAAKHNPALRALPRNLAYVIHTSGSTGTPKGAMVERLGMYNNLMTKIPALGLRPDDVIAQTASQAFDISIWQFLTPLIRGACADILPDPVAKDPLALLGALRERAITILESVPSMIRALLDASEESGPPLKLRWLLPTGEALSPDLCRKWFARYPAIPMLNAYGPAECADDVAYHRIDAAPAIETLIMPIGRPVANLRLYILDRCLEPAPADVPGELCVAGMGVGRGYINRPSLTAASFLPDPFDEPGERLYRTGDLARYRDDGTIDFLGRIDDQVKIRGHRIEVGEVETQLKGHCEVRDAAVVAWPDGKLGHRLVAYVVPKEKGRIEPNALRVALHDRLPDYMVPSVWVELPKLPINRNGKLDRKALPRPAKTDEGESFEAPLTPTEQIVAALWAGLLDCERIGRHHNFFELGGHSLLATQAIARTNHAFSTNITLRALFDSPTLARFARSVDDARNCQDEFAGLRVTRAPRTQSLPLSHAQLRLWFMYQMDPANPLYHFTVAARITGPFDANAFEASLNAIVRRHESLRTVFQEHEGEVYQVILPELVVTVEREQAENVASAEAMCREELLARLRNAAAVPFDLAHGPLVRAKVYERQLAQNDQTQVCVVLLGFHHIVFDGWSFGVFLKEFAALYPAMRHAGEPLLPRLPMQYADYAAWQHRQMQSKQLARQLEYWTEHLRGAPLLLELPADHPRSLETGDAAASYEFDLSNLRSPLTFFDHQHATTSFMTVLAAFAVLLSYFSGARDLLVGADVANRRRGEFEPLIGFFINLVALRIRFVGDATFNEILSSVRDVTLAAYDNQDLPLDKLVEALHPQRSTSHSAIFQVKLVFHNVPLTELALPELRFESIPFETNRTELDLVLHVYETRQEIRAVFEYRTGLFEAATIARFAELLRLLLQSVLAHPGANLSALMDFLAQHDRALRSAARAEQRANQLDRLQAAKRGRIRAG